MNDKFPNDILRSIIGLERLLSNNFKPETFPKYEILKNENKYKLRLLLAGYKQEDIEISIENDNLLISHDKKDKETVDEGYIPVSEKVISTRSFRFKIGIYNLEVKSAKFTDGILEILLEEKQNEDKKIIQIN